CAAAFPVGNLCVSGGKLVPGVDESAIRWLDRWHSPLSTAAVAVGAAARQLARQGRSFPPPVVDYAGRPLALYAHLGVCDRRLDQLSAPGSQNLAPVKTR